MQKMPGLSPASQSGGPGTWRRSETFGRMSPAQNECLQAQNGCLLETFNAECLQARAGAAGAGDTITTIISYVPGLLLFCELCGHESTCSLHI